MRPVFPNTPIDGRLRHAHHFDGSHGCSDHFHVEPHRDDCYHRHVGTGHLISIDAECGFERDEQGTVTRMAG